MPRAATEPLYAYFGGIVEKRKDDAGNLLVYGKAAGDDLDLDSQVLDATWLAGAVPEWFDSGANVRLSHDMHRPVGKGTEHEVKDDGHWLMSKVVDSEAQKLVDEGVLMGYSVGIKNPQIRKDAKAPNGRIVGGQIIEISLVDRPANPACVLTLAKAAGPDTSVVLPAGVAPETDKGLVRTEEIVKVTTSAGHSHLHTHEDGAHEHAHPHSPIDGHYDHGDDGEAVPHEHAHDPKDPPRTEETETSETGESLSEPERDKAAAQALIAPQFDAGPQAPDELHKATVAKMAASGSSTQGGDTLTSGTQVNGTSASVTMSLAELQATIDASIQKALAGLDKQAKKDPSEPHAFVDDNGDGKCDACGEKRGDGMHHKDFGKVTEPTVVKKDYSTETRAEMAKKGQAIPVRNDKGEITGGRYPIADGGDLSDAISSFGRAKDSDADEVKAYIKKRAKALGMTDKIPDSWKVADYDAAKAMLGDKGLLTKQEDGDGDGEVDQMPAYAATCQGLATLIQQEAAELASGSDEYWSLYALLQALQGLRQFRAGEIREGEMDGPSPDGYPMWMGAVADLTKAVQSLPGTVASEVAKALKPAEVRAEKGLPSFDPADFAATLRKELATAMKPFEGIEALDGRMAKVEETVERIAKSPVPTGPHRTGMPTNGPTLKSPAAAHREKAAYYKEKAASMSDPTMAQGFRSLADDELAKAAALDGAKPT